MAQMQALAVAAGPNARVEDQGHEPDQEEGGQQGSLAGWFNPRLFLSRWGLTRLLSGEINRRELIGSQRGNVR
jgi:hypothetical protein